MEAATQTQNVGRIEEIQGVVIEAVFPDELPEINHAITVDRGDDGDARLRGAAAPRRRPRARGRDGHHRRPGARHGGASTPAGPITVPVGEATLGRIFNLLGEPIDLGDPVDDRGALADPPRRARRREPDADHRDARDRHQGRRPAGALREGRQGRPVRRRRRRQDRDHHGADQQHRQAARRPVGVLRRGRAHARGQRALAAR